MTDKQERFTVSKVEEGIFDASTISDFQRCMRRGYYRWILGLVPDVFAEALVLGDIVHRCLAYETETGDAERALNYFYHPDAKRLWDLPIGGKEGRRHPTNVMKILKGYFEFYKGEPRREILGVEMPFQLRMPNGTTLAGVTDEAYRRNKLMFVREHKTTTMGGDRFFNNFEINFQITCYAYAVREHFQHVDSVEVNAVLIDEVKPIRLKKDGTPYANSKPKVWYDRRLFNFDTIRYSNWMDTYIALTNYIMSVPKKIEYFWMCDTNCQDFGHCPYTNLCKYGDKGLRVGYRQEDAFREVTLHDEVPEKPMNLNAFSDSKQPSTEMITLPDKKVPTFKLENVSTKDEGYEEI